MPQDARRQRRAFEPELRQVLFGLLEGLARLQEVLIIERGQPRVSLAVEGLADLLGHAAIECEVRLDPRHGGIEPRVLARVPRSRGREARSRVAGRGEMRR